MKKKCRRCGNYFDTNNGYTATMCDDCASGKPVAGRMVLGFEDTPEEKRARGLVQCVWCGKWYMPKRTEKGQYHLCSAICQHDMRNSTFKELQEHGIEMARSCDYCGKPIVSKAKQQPKYCGAECRHRAKIRDMPVQGSKILDPKPCRYCGKLFNPSKVSQLYCSHSCSKSSQKYRKICVECGKAFVAGSEDVLECAFCRSFKEVSDQVEHPYPNKETGTCAVCGDRFETRQKNQYTCSDRCRKTYRAELNKYYGALRRLKKRKEQEENSAD